MIRTSLTTILCAVMISLLAHGYALFYTIDQVEEAPPVPKTAGYADIKVVENTSVQKEIEKTAPKISKTPEKAPKGKKCPGNNWYGGIGMVSNEGIVTQVFKGYPAYNNGLKVGDLIVSPDNDHIRGDPGTTIKIKVLRGQLVIYFVFKRDKICYVQEDS